MEINSASDSIYTVAISEEKSEIIVSTEWTRITTDEEEVPAEESSTEELYTEEIVHAEETTKTEETTTQHENNYTQTTTSHIHSYVTNVDYVNHPEEGHYEERCVVEGRYEDVYEYYEQYCYNCGAVMDRWSFEELVNHSAIHGSYGSHKKVVDTIWHEPIYENVWIVDKEGYVEEVVTEKCIECGYVK